MASDPLESLRAAVTGLFPWLAGVRLASDGGLSLRIAKGLLHLAGDAGDPAAARVGDEASQIAFYPGVPATTPPSLWISYDGGATWAPVAVTLITGPPPNTPGTPIRITAGSGKVTIA